jgi:hypothetical protein
MQLHVHALIHILTGVNGTAENSHVVKPQRKLLNLNKNAQP